MSDQWQHPDADEIRGRMLATFVQDGSRDPVEVAAQIRAWGWAEPDDDVQVFTEGGAWQQPDWARSGDFALELIHPSGRVGGGGGSGRYPVDVVAVGGESGSADGRPGRPGIVVAITHRRPRPDR